MRRFLRQEMVTEVVRSALYCLPVCSHYPSNFVHTSAHTCCTRLSLLFHSTRSPGSSLNSASASGQLGESPHPSLGLAVPLGTVGRRVGL